MLKDITKYRKEALRAARDFAYGYEVECRIRKAASEAEISRIMATARHEKWKGVY